MDGTTAGRLCGCSFIHPQRTLREGLALVKALGFAHADIGIGGGNGHFDPIQVAQDPPGFADLIRRDIEESGLLANEGFTLNFGPPINSPAAGDRARTRELFAGLCRMAARAGLRSLMLIPGPVHLEVGTQGSLDLCVHACTELAAIAAEHNLLLNIEADCDSCANTPEAAAELCERVPGLGLTLDYSHFVSQGIAVERVRMLHPYTRHIHIRQAAPGHIVDEPNAGTIDYADELKLLSRAGYAGLYCIEYLSLEAGPEAFALSEARTRAMAAVVQSCLE